MCTYYDTLFVTSVTPFYSGEYKWVCKCVWLYFHALQMYWQKNSKAFAYWVTGFFPPLSSSLSLPISLSLLCHPTLTPMITVHWKTKLAEYFLIYFEHTDISMVLICRHAAQDLLVCFASDVCVSVSECHTPHAFL